MQPSDSQLLTQAVFIYYVLNPGILYRVYTMHILLVPYGALAYYVHMPGYSRGQNKHLQLRVAGVYVDMMLGESITEFNCAMTVMYPDYCLLDPSHIITTIGAASLQTDI